MNAGDVVSTLCRMLPLHIRCWVLNGKSEPLAAAAQATALQAHLSKRLFFYDVSAPHSPDCTL